jgi:amino acid adenylation domain-containing protein
LLAILKDANPQALITRTSQVDRFAGYQGDIICVNSQKEEIAKESHLDYRNDCKAENAACVIYTSGSTGAPKGILMSNRNIVNLIYSFTLSYKPGPGDSILPLTSIASASFVGEILPILVSGGRIVLADKVHFLDMKKLTALMSAYCVTILSTVPSMIARLNSAELKPEGLRLLLSGGETLSASDIHKLRDSITIVNGYGLTEATICSTYIILNENKNDFGENSLISVGSPIINTLVYILDKNRNPVPIGVPGEIYIGGHGISHGYLNNPELTTDKFINSLTFQVDNLQTNRLIFRTGDLGCFLSDGSIKFLGRIDTQVQIHGHRIELSEIETHLGLYPGIRDVVVVDREVVRGDRRLVAYIVPEGGKIPGSGQLRDWLDKRIPDYMIPSLFEAVDELPLNINGKVDIPALPEPSWDRPELNVDYKAPQTGIEKAIASLWQDILRVEKVGINDNFFDLGGHSLLLTQLHSSLSELNQNSKELTIVDLFRYPTIYSLGKYIEEDGKKDTAEIYNKIQSRGEKQRRAFKRKQFKVR